MNDFRRSSFASNILFDMFSQLGCLYLDTMRVAFHGPWLHAPAQPSILAVPHCLSTFRSNGSSHSGLRVLHESMVEALRDTVRHDVRHAMLEPETQVQQPLGRHRRRRRGVEISAPPAPSRAAKDHTTCQHAAGSSWSIDRKPERIEAETCVPLRWFEGRVARRQEPRDLGHRVAAGGAQVPPLGARRLHEEDVRVAGVLNVRQRDAPEPRVHGGQQRVELGITCSVSQTEKIRKQKFGGV